GLISPFFSVPYVVPPAAATPKQPMPAKPTTALKDNQEAVEQAIREVFASPEAEVKGVLVKFEYHPNCGISQFSERLLKDCGPGYRLQMSFDGSNPIGYFYPEIECPTLEEFIKNLNTDFGMRQIQSGRRTKGLGIDHYDLNDDEITFFIRPN